MAFDKQQFEDILNDFTIDSDELREIAGAFRYDLKQGARMSACCASASMATANSKS